MFRQMEKLKDLLNEYDPFICGDGTYTDNHRSYVLDGHNTVYPKSVAKNVIISKSYGFIKWLVENEKIDFSKLSVSYIYHDDEGSWEQELLMQLAIQDEPIEFLVSILK